MFPFNGTAMLKVISGSATTASVNIEFTPESDAENIIIGGRRYGGVFTATITDAAETVIASALITATADSSGKNATSLVTIENVACQLKKDEKYTLNIPAQTGGSGGYCMFAFAIYP